MHTFHMAPTEMRTVRWVVVLLVLSIVITVIVLSLRPVRMELSPAGLNLRGTIYGRFIPASQLRLKEARVITYATSPELRPVLRTNGAALPGFQSGWFRLKDGEKALLYVTHRDSIVYIPTTAGYCLLLTPADQSGFMAALAAQQH